MHIMKRILISIMLILSIALLASCAGGASDKTPSGESEPQGETFVKMTATVLNVTDRLEVDVIEGEYGASGIFWVNVSNETTVTDRDGAKLTLADIKKGSTVEIKYGGQVMMSYPPQISAISIKISE